MPNILNNFFDLFFPKECLNCGKTVEFHEKLYCLFCLSEIPITKFSQIQNNELERLFRGRLTVEAASALIFYAPKGLTKQMIHLCKYQGKHSLSQYLGQWLAKEMQDSQRFDHLDYVVPVPMHPIKRKKRGYDQVHIFARALADTLDLPMLPDVLQKENYHETQSSKNRFDRFKTLSHDFKIGDGLPIENKHVLLVDDIVTTGATMEACGSLLLHKARAKLSLACMAFTT